MSHASTFSASILEHFLPFCNFFLALSVDFFHDLSFYHTEVELINMKAVLVAIAKQV